MGQSAALSGPTQALALDVRRGIDAYLSYVNRNGGVSGRQILLKSFDDMGDAGAATANARLLVQREGVVALIASVGVSSSEAVADVAAATGVPLIAPISGAESLRSVNLRHVYNLRASQARETQRLAQQLASMGLTKVAAAYQDDALGREGAKAFDKACREAGVQAVLLQRVGSRASEIQVAAKALASVEPKAIVLFATYDVGTEIIRASRAAGYGAIFMTVSSAGSKALSEVLLEDARGTGMTQVVPFPWSAGVPLVAQYQRLMLESGFSMKDFSYGSLEGFLAARVAVEGLKRSGRDPSAAKLAQSLDSLGEYDLGGMRIHYSAQDHSGANFVDLTVMGPGGRFLK